jgi:hypothetical protein
MNKWLICFCLLFAISAAKAQEQKNIADLEFLYRQIQKLPAYKDQLKDDQTYAQLYQRLRKELNTSNDFEAYQKMLALIYPINDNHLGFYRKPDSAAKFKPAPPKINLLLLRQKYATYPIDSIQGIYTRGNAKFLIYPDETNYNLVDLENGELKAILHKNKFNAYDAIVFINATYVLYRNVKSQNGFLNGLTYYKGNSSTLYHFINRKEKYSYQVLNEETGYLSLGSFGSSDQTIKEATDFFREAKPKITAKHLIVDVRSNTGGGYKNSGQFIRFLKNFEGKIYILQNGLTVSNAEQFILDLKSLKNVTTLGQTTKGMIAYGSNYGENVDLPSKRFTFYPTDMAGSKRDLAFESIGIKPDVELDFKEDWVAQTLKYIKAN